MMTVKEVCKLTGVSARTLHHYDAIGLLKPAAVTSAGYRLYNSKNLERLSQIMLFKELEFSLSDIKSIIDNPSFDKQEALTQQIKLLSLKKDRIENLISLAEQIKVTGVYKMDFKAFSNEKIANYTADAKRKWGNTAEYKEFETKTANYSNEKQKSLADGMMQIFKDFGKLTNKSPEGKEAQSLVKKLKDFITENYYTCSNEILLSLGNMYVSGGEMTYNIDSAGGEGTAAFAKQAIDVYCNS